MSHSAGVHRSQQDKLPGRRPAGIFRTGNAIENADSRIPVAFHGIDDRKSPASKRRIRHAAEAIMTDKLIDRNPDILGGTPVFNGTRVPVRILMEHLEAGDGLDEFLDDYPTVTREQAVQLLERRHDGTGGR